MEKEQEHAYLMAMGKKMNLVDYGTFLSTYHAAKIKFSDVAPEDAEVSKKAIRLARKLIAKKRQKGYMVRTTAQMAKEGYIQPNPHYHPKSGKVRWFVAGGAYRRQGEKILFKAHVAWEKIY